MQRLVASLLLSVFVLTGFTPQGATSLASRSVEVQITHSHEEGSHSHTHDFAPFSKAENIQISTEKSTDKEDQSHSHTMVIAATVAIVVPQFASFVLAPVTGNSIQRTQDQRAPVDRSLGSIFRPPILA